MQRDVALAWRIENFSRAGNRLKNLDKYLDELKPIIPPAEQAAAIFEGFAKRGLATIKERKRDAG